MTIENITFENDDTLTQTLTKIVQINAGSHRLKTELTKHKVNYHKIIKGAFTFYILRSPKIGVLKVKL